MRAPIVLGAALAAAAAVAACSGGPEADVLGSGGRTPSDQSAAGDTITGNPTGGGASTGATTPDAPPDTPGNLPTNSPAGKAFYVATMHPVLETKCGACHAAGGVGTPTWIVRGDGAKTYELIYAQTFATAQSRIVIKGVHSGGAAPELTAEDKSKWAQFIALEVKEGGQKTQTNVLEKFGSCFDKAKFDAINFGQLRTTRRQNGNNPQNLNENANNCTGCDNAPCRTCHSADDVTGFVMAIGNPILPADYTFERSKLLNPAFIRQYVSTTPTGEPQFNPGIKSKSINTIEKAKAYEHPMYRLTPTMDAAIKAFVDDALAKYAAGTCGK